MYLNRNNNEDIYFGYKYPYNYKLGPLTLKYANLIFGSFGIDCLSISAREIVFFVVYMAYMT